MSQTAPSVRADSRNNVSRAILQGLQDRIGPQKFNAWFRHGTSLSVQAGRVRVAVPNPFVANWIENHFRADVAAAAQDKVGRECGVVVMIDPSLTGKLRKKQLDSQADIVTRAAQGRTRQRRDDTPAPLRCRLHDFVVGQNNRLAYSAAQAMVSDQRAPFHPLFIHGSCGVGKTHLLQGICNALTGIVRDGRPVAWRYVTGEQFTNEFVRAIRTKSFGQFRARFRQLDLLAIDDVHFLASKKAIQEEFLHTFNAIAAAGKQVVLASDAHPRMVGELSEHLASRFVAGMVVKIDAPDEATRMTILLRKAAAMKLKIARDILQYVARHVRASVRELEGALFKLSALSALGGKAVDLQMARDALADHLARTGSVLTVGDIEAAVAAFFGITPADIQSSRRTRTVSAARMVAMYLARRHTAMSYPEIGRFMGKNHSSVVLAVQKMEQAVAADAPVRWTGAAGKKSMPARQLVKLLTEQIS